MVAYSHQKRSRLSSKGMLFVGMLILFAMLFTACGSNTTTGSSSTPTANPATPTIAAPSDLITPGTLTVGSDTTYPPQEFVDPTTGQATGFDIDLITAMAQQMGLKTTILKANFNTIVDDLVAKRYDVVISAQTINDERKKKVDFVPYFSAGESLLVQNSNPLNIKSVNDLCGQTVGVQDGTVELDDLNAASKSCTGAGKQAIKLTILKDQTDVIQLLVNKRVVATYQDSPVTDYYIKLNPGQFQIGGSVVNAAPEGISVRKGDTSMFNAIQSAFQRVKSDGTYDALFKKWQLNDAQKISLSDRRTIYA
ncbi:MAG TPA: ABC transporter substrate-binding protein [Ktedonobacteraceae bacterium]|nr:ABC transporter substrate-binding protein [Ktedonobacteraceae bacterium]